MRSSRVGTINGFLDPHSDGWSGVQKTSVELIPTPLGLQPNGYIKASWEDRAYGLVENLEVSSIHDGQQVVFRLRWQSIVQSLGEGENFPDGAAIALPVRGEPDLATMGSSEHPIHALYWSARNNELRSVLAAGIGSSRAGPEVGATAKADWHQGVWSLVIARDLSASDDAPSFHTRAETRIGFAIWSGANQERAGIKAYSIDWLDLTIAP